jgi:hypothetical protein
MLFSTSVSWRRARSSDGGFGRAGAGAGAALRAATFLTRGAALSAFFALTRELGRAGGFRPDFGDFVAFVDFRAADLRALALPRAGPAFRLRLVTRFLAIVV